jgi:acyl carrier protein
MSTLTAVQRIIVSETSLRVEELDSARSLEGIGVDSLAVIEVMFRLEEEFKIMMPDERVPIQTIQDIANLVDRLLAERDAKRG